MTILQTITDKTNSDNTVLYAQVATSSVNVITIVIDKDQEYASGLNISNAMKCHKSGDKSAVLWSTNSSFTLSNMIGANDAEKLLTMFMAAYYEN